MGAPIQDQQETRLNSAGPNQPEPLAKLESERLEVKFNLEVAIAVKRHQEEGGVGYPLKGNKSFQNLARAEELNSV